MAPIRVVYLPIDLDYPQRWRKRRCRREILHRFCNQWLSCSIVTSNNQNSITGLMNSAGLGSSDEGLGSYWFSEKLPGGTAVVGYLMVSNIFRTLRPQSNRFNIIQHCWQLLCWMNVWRQSNAVQHYHIKKKKRKKHHSTWFRITVPNSTMFNGVK